MTDVAALIERQREGFTLEAGLYRAPAVLAAELALIFRRHWLFAGHSCEVPKPGDFFTYKIGEDSLIVVRAEDGRLRALHNVCRHRGSLVCERAQGHAMRLVCPYHAWTYGLDGRLLRAPGTSGLDRSRFGLKSIHAEEVAGLIFVNLAERPEPIDALRAHFEPILGPQRLERARIAKVVDYDLPVNWKTVVENNRECLHCPANHRLYVSVTYDVDNHDPARRAEIEARLAECRERWAAMGLDTSRVNTSSDATAPGFRANRTPVRQGFVTESRDGRPVAPLMGDFSDSTWAPRAPTPTSTSGATPTATMPTQCASRRLPPTARSSVRTGWSGTMRSKAATTTSSGSWRSTPPPWPKTGRSAGGSPQGVRSSAYEPGPLSPDREQNVQGFLHWYLGVMRVAGERL